MTKRTVILPDTQMPFDSRRALKAVIGFIGDFQPDEVVHIGDLMDYPTPARWSKGSAEEFAKLMRMHNEQAKTRLLGPLREVYDGPIGVHEGNHDLRPRTYLTKYAPALGEFEDDFHIKVLLDFDGFGIDALADRYQIAPGWISTHGHLGKISLSRIAGQTATNAAKKMGCSVVMGHTHRQGLGSYTTGRGGSVDRIVTGMEVGHLMDMKQAHYLAGATADWQMGFGILTVDGQIVRPEPIGIYKGGFSVDGHTWKV